MTPHAFIQKWQHATLKERSAAQEHFLNLCALLEEPSPADADPTGTWYSFEKGAKKTGGGEGWADVWKRQRWWLFKRSTPDLRNALQNLDKLGCKRYLAAAYGWPADLSDDEILRRLLGLNLERAGKSI